ncbi:MAG: DEAD/DEAH box helicase [Chloroflexota bacterium]|nr:DEAD/DEAH box helicase [Chloroflexota bacterium]
MRWRRAVVNSTGTFCTLGPCGQEFGNQLPECCTECWQFRRESFHQPPLYQAFRYEINKLTRDKRPFSQFENALLSWSYTILEKSKGNDPSRRSPVVDGDYIDGPITLRYLGTYKQAVHEEWEAVSSGPDQFQARPSQRSWVEYLKVCPAASGTQELVFERRPGFEVPSLQYGQPFKLSKVTVVKANGTSRMVLQPRQGDETRIELFKQHEPQGITSSSFLPGYTDTTRRAIDEIGYRLFGFPSMHDFQHAILGRVLTQQSTLGIAATGGGKSECFILPAILLAGVTIVVAPLKSLMIDQYEERIKRRYGLDHVSTFINGDVPYYERQARLTRMEQGYYKLVYFTPEQLERGYVLESLKRTHRHRRVGIRYLAMDEAHCISQWGHNFRPSYLNILRRLQAQVYTEPREQPVVIALTATASPKVREDICDELGLRSHATEDNGDVYVYSSNRPELNLVVRVRDTTREKSHEILEELHNLDEYNRHNQRKGAALIFQPHTGGNPNDTWRYLPRAGQAESSRGVESAGVTSFASFLERELQRRVAIYHSKFDDTDAPQGDVDLQEAARAYRHTIEQKPYGDLSGRTAELEQYTYVQGLRDIMVATKGFGMGIDKPNIRVVLHRTPPGNLESYAQEAGRAGRDHKLATAILLYSPDTPEERDAAGIIRKKKSDDQIQRHFLSENYVRRMDVEVMHGFLKTVTWRMTLPGAEGGRDRRLLYFTNDAAIAYFDTAEGYEWPEFEPRDLKTFEVRQRMSVHSDLLDRGYTYDKKTRYVARILAVLFRIRPTVGGHTKLALLENVQETGARVFRPTALAYKNWQRIQSSNAHFGKLFRDHGVSCNEFKRFVEGQSLLPLAQRLQISVKEAAAMLSDIKFSEGRFDENDRWQSDLLDFWWIEAPRHGPAQGKDDLRQWRDYAGARTRASEVDFRRRRAADATRKKQIKDPLDLWFSWKELNRPVGWEVELGPAFESTDWTVYRDAFMRLHDERKQNDWDSYFRLLTSYVGVNADGTITGAKRQDTCLRAVMLGYLKSYEIILQNNCLSCSACVPNEQFDRYSLEERMQRVQRMREETSSLFDQMEAYAEQLPAAHLVTRFFTAMRKEAAHGRSLVQYADGWSGRLLQDTPNHRAALLVRIEAMIDGTFTLQPQECINNAANLVTHVAEHEFAAVSDVLRSLQEVIPDEASVYRVQADLCRRQGSPGDEADVWRHLVKRAATQGSVTDDVLREAFTHLLELSAPTGRNSDASEHRAARLELGRLGTSRVVSQAHYAYLVSTWTWEEAHAEAAHCQLGNRPVAAASALIAWSTAATKHLLERAEQVAIALPMLDAVIRSTITDWVEGTIKDDPQNVVAAWLSIRSTIAGMVALDIPQFVAVLDQITRITDVSNASVIWPWVQRATRHTPNEPEIYRIEASYASRIGRHADAAQTWHALLERIEGSQVPTRPWAYAAHTALAALYGADGPLGDAALAAVHRRLAMRYENDTRRAKNFYTEFAGQAGWTDVQDEACALLALPHAETLVPHLLRAWLDQGQGEDVSCILNFIEAHQDDVEHWSASDVETLISVIPRDVLQQHALLIAKLVTIVQDSTLLLRLAEIALNTDHVFDSGTIRRIAQTAGKAGATGTEVLRLLLNKSHTRPLTYTALKELNALTSWHGFSAWLNQFAGELQSEVPDELVRLLRQGFYLLPRHGNRPTALQQLVALSQTVLDSPTTAAEAHAIWHEHSLVHTDLIEPYLKLCSAQASGGTYAQHLLEILLEQGKAQLIAELTGPLPYPDWQCALRMIQQLASFKKTAGLRSATEVNPALLHILSNTFDARHDADQADMLAASVAQLGKRASPNYLTALAREMEALVFGGHFAEVRQRAARLPDLRLGRERLSVEDFIAQHATHVTEREASVPPVYRSIAAAMLR